MSDEDLEEFGRRRQKRIQTVAWITIGALLLSGGAASVLTLLLG